MYYILASIASVLVSFMIFVNGKSLNYFNLYTSLTLINLVGLITTFIFLLVTKNNLLIKKKVKPYYFLGGVVGYLLTFFNVVAFNKIPLSSIIALALLGQVLTSLIIDNFGLFKMKINKISKNNVLGIIIISIGIITMLYQTPFKVIPILFAFLSGITIVITRQLNAGLSYFSNAYTSSLYNFLTGFIFSSIILFISYFISDSKCFTSSFGISDAWVLLGGVIALIINILLNISVSHLSSFNMTLIIFSGQLLTGIFLDYISLGIFSLKIFLGSVFALTGLFINTRKS